MPKNLVIVESPAKAKTIEKYLGKDFMVKSSYGHIRDLDKGDDAINLQKNYLPRYIVPSDKKKLVKELIDLAKKADTIWLASDEDREGEAISWHLYEVLGLKDENTKRIVFNEITKTAIEKAIQNPRKIDLNLVNAQQARRVLDRLVGFELSPLLWKKVKPSLSAGRVQSVAVKLVVEREREIRAFNSVSEFKVTAQFKASDKSFKAILDKRFGLEKDAQSFLEICKQSQFKVNSVEKKPGTKNPSPPFTTSTLQQEASRKLGFPVGVTMQVAQKLYEEGHISYMRTDSVNLSDTALAGARDAIKKEYGEQYAKTRKFSTKSAGAQDAHEAIRPTDFNAQFAGSTERERKLYNLIWKRSIASQMESAKVERTIIKIDNNKNKHNFVAEGEVILFDGFLKVYMESSDDEENEETEGILPNVSVGQELTYTSIIAEEKFNNPPARFTEASLVKKLEELGIGRPSTYAPTISTIQKRGYVETGKKEGEVRELKFLKLTGENIKSGIQTQKTGSEKGKLLPTDIGGLVTDFLSENFKEIMDYGFTASVEKQFDDIAEGYKEWSKMIDNFYLPFHKTVNETLNTAAKVTGERELGIDPKTKLMVSVRMGRYGPFVQLGEATENKKPQYASLRTGQSIESISLEDALELFKLPRTIGVFEDADLVANVGRFGPYILHNKKFYSLPKDLDPFSVNEEEAIRVINDKRESESSNSGLPINLGEWEGSEIEINVGRFGPYAKYNSKYFSIAKGTDLAKVTKEQAIEIIKAKLEEAQKNIIKTLGEKDEISILKGKYGPYMVYKKKNYKLDDIDPEALTEAKAMEIINAGKKTKKSK
jgi:DNA topoisomerase-1